MTLCKMNKKGQEGVIVFDLIVLVIVLMVFAMVALFGWQAFSELNPTLQNDLTLNESKETLNQVDTRYPSVMDGIILFIFLGMWAAAIVAALMSDQHPLLFGFMMILVVFVLIASAMIANYFEETYQDEELSALTGSFPKLNWIMTHLMELTLIVALSVILALLGKNRA